MPRRPMYAAAKWRGEIASPSSSTGSSRSKPSSSRTSMRRVTRRIEVLLELGFARDEPVELDGLAISPRHFAAAYIGRRGIGASDRSANVKQVQVAGTRAGKPVTVVYDFAVEQVGRSASSAITGTVAAIAADLVSRGGPLGVHPPEGAFDPPQFLAALAERGFAIQEQEIAG